MLSGKAISGSKGMRSTGTHFMQNEERRERGMMIIDVESNRAPRLVSWADLGRRRNPVTPLQLSLLQSQSEVVEIDVIVNS